MKAVIILTFLFFATNEFSSICEQDVNLEKEEAAKDHKSHFTELQVHSVITKLEPFIHTQLLNLLCGIFKTSKPCKVDRDIITPGRVSRRGECNLSSPRFVLCGKLFADIQQVCSLKTLTRLHSSTWATKWFKRLVAYAKCDSDSYERCGARMLNKLQESIPNRSSRMLYRMIKLPEMVDVARRSRLGAWLRA
ncbi:hypothetical protein Tco_0402014 [Tanacetum coccineum]